MRVGLGPPGISCLPVLRRVDVAVFDRGASSPRKTGFDLIEIVIVQMRRQLLHAQRSGPDSAGNTARFRKKIMTGGRYVV